MPLISVVVPCYNEEHTLPVFYEAVCQTANKMEPEVSFELFFVDDGSWDGTLKLIEELNLSDPRIKYISLSRNFGKEAALYAGLEHAIGDYVVTMDCDMQDPPAMLETMYEDIITGDYDCIATRRISRKGEPPIRSFFARCFYRLINRISHTEIVDGARDFRLMTRKMTDSVLSLKEYNRFSKGIFSWVGFRTKWIEYENIERVAGETKWSFWKLFKYSLDGIAAFSTAPLMLASISGILFCLLAFLLIIWVVIKTLVWGDPVAGFPSLICVILFIGGIQLLSIGIIGQYLSKTYLETKRRPIYITKKEKLD